MGVTTTIYSLCSLVIKTIAEQNTLTYSARPRGKKFANTCQLILTQRIICVRELEQNELVRSTIWKSSWKIKTKASRKQVLPANSLQRAVSFIQQLLHRGSYSASHNGS